MNFKNIHIGNIINQAVIEREIEISRICNFMKITEEDIKKMYKQEDLPCNLLLKWSKLLEYDFFRIYSQHLILYSPSAAEKKDDKKKKTELPQFRKNIYTKEVIDFILDQIESKELTINEVMKRYRIPKTTIYRWQHKYKK
ncbi:MAG: transposase [Empedobacter falsenii]